MTDPGTLPRITQVDVNNISVDMKPTICEISQFGTLRNVRWKMVASFWGSVLRNVREEMLVLLPLQLSHCLEILVPGGVLAAPHVLSESYMYNVERHAPHARRARWLIRGSYAFLINIRFKRPNLPTRRSLDNKQVPPPLNRVTS